MITLAEKLLLLTPIEYKYYTYKKKIMDHYNIDNSLLFTNDIINNMWNLYNAYYSPLKEMKYTYNKIRVFNHNYYNKNILVKMYNITVIGDQDIHCYFVPIKDIINDKFDILDILPDLFSNNPIIVYPPTKE